MKLVPSLKKKVNIIDLEYMENVMNQAQQKDGDNLEDLRNILKIGLVKIKQSQLNA
jgi:hypothetical protein